MTGITMRARRPVSRQEHVRHERIGRNDTLPAAALKFVLLIGAHVVVRPRP